MMPALASIAVGFGLLFVGLAAWDTMSTREKWACLAFAILNFFCAFMRLMGHPI